MKTWMRCLFLLLAAVMFQRCAAGAVVCSVSSTGTAFGTYDTLSATTKDVVGTISVTCSGVIGDAVNYSIALSPGAGSFSPRNMLGISPQFNYNLFADGAHTSIWGDGTAGTAIVSDTYSLSASTITRQYTVFGEIPGQNAPVAGAYADTLVITLTY